MTTGSQSAATAPGTSDGAGAEFEFVDGEDGATFRLRGLWTVAHIGDAERRLGRLQPPAANAVLCDVSGVGRMDTAGAWLIHRTMAALRDQGTATRFTGVTPEQRLLLDQVAAQQEVRATAPRRRGGLVDALTRTGETVVDATGLVRDLVGFLGLVLVATGRIILKPSRLRLTSLVHHMEQVGFRALPIVGLISFLIGIVLAYQGAQQLQRFGAEVFVVQLLEISVLREIAILLTAIVVAGRSASAFTSEIGSMKLQEEFDALRSFGLDPLDFLILPRVFALLITLPMLGFFAGLMGLLGGALTSWMALDVSPAMFIGRFHEASNVWNLWVGLIKAPFFALAIGLVGCFHGLLVEGSAESLGRRTTESVVLAIFLVIVLDAAFSIFFAALGI